MIVNLENCGKTNKQTKNPHETAATSMRYHSALLWILKRSCNLSDGGDIKAPPAGLWQTAVSSVWLSWRRSSAADLRQ